MRRLILNEIGGSICGSFILFGGLSVLLYKPWRRRIDRIRDIHHQPQQLQDEDGTVTGAHSSRRSNDGRGSRIRQEAADRQSHDVISKVRRDTTTPSPLGGS